MHVAEDANFKQKARVRPNDDRDQALLPGSAAFVDNEKYSSHLRSAMKLSDAEVCIHWPDQKVPGELC
jgi:hypothetical protein